MRLHHIHFRFLTFYSQLKIIQICLNGSSSEVSVNGFQSKSMTSRAVGCSVQREHNSMKQRQFYILKICLCKYPFISIISDKSDLWILHIGHMTDIILLHTLYLQISLYLFNSLLVMLSHP